MGEYQIIAMAAGMFFEFGIKDFIDILLVAFLLYYVYKLMKASGSIKVFTGILVLILIWLVVTQVLEMKLLGSIFNTLMNVGVYFFRMRYAVFCSHLVRINMSMLWHVSLPGIKKSH